MPTFTDSPDWQEVTVTVPAAGDMPDAPDWQRTVVAPGGTPSGGVTSWNGRTGAVDLKGADVEALFGAAGQLLVGTGAGAGELLGVGSAGQVLTVGGSDPSGLEWATPQSGRFNGYDNPSDWGFSAWSFPWPQGNSSETLISQQVTCNLIKAPTSFTANSIGMLVINAGGGVANAFLVLYSLGVANPSVVGSWGTSTLDLLAQTNEADTISAFSSTGWAELPLTAPLDVVAGQYYYVGYLLSFSGSPEIATIATGGINSQLPGYVPKAWAQPGGSGTTSPPATLSASSLVFGIGTAFFTLQ